MPPEAEPQEKLNRLTESQRLSARTAAKPRQADGVWLRLAALCLVSLWFLGAHITTETRRHSGAQRKQPWLRREGPAQHNTRQIQPHCPPVDN